MQNTLCMFSPQKWWSYFLLHICLHFQAVLIIYVNKLQGSNGYTDKDWKLPKPLQAQGRKYEHL